MFDSASSLILFAGASMVLLRPADVPILARFAGRLAGFSVRGMRAVRDVTEQAFAHGEKELGKQGDLGIVREDLRQSFSHFNSLRTTVTRDFRSIGPIASIGVIRSRLTGQSTAVQPTIEKNTKTNFPTQPPLIAAKGLASLQRGTQRSQVTTGVDFIARSIQEAALAEQQDRIFSRHPNHTSQSGPHLSTISRGS